MPTRPSSHRPSWRLFRSTIAESAPYIGLTFLILTTLVFIQQLGRHSQVVLSFEASAEIMATFMASVLPGIIVVTLPVSLVLGTVITCSRQSADNELTAARACGIDPRWLGLPFLLLGLAGTLLSLWLTTDVAPSSLRRLKSLRARILLQEATLRIRPHTFITTFPEVLLFVQSVDERTGEWIGVFILQQDKAGKQTRIVTAERGRLRIATDERSSVEAELFNGVSSETGGSVPVPSVARQNPPAVALSDAGTTGIASASDFQKASIRLIERGQEESRAGFPDSGGALAEMTLSQLRQESLSAPGQPDRLRARVEWHKRLALPFASLLLTGLTFLIALRGTRMTTRPRRVVAILFISLIYYLLLVAGQNIASSGYIPVWLAVWLPNLVAAGIIIVMSSFNLRLGIKKPENIPAPFLSASPIKPLSNLPEMLLNHRRFNFHLIRRKLVQNSPINFINYLIVSEIFKFYFLAVTVLVVTSITFTLFDLIPALSKSTVTVGYALIYLAYLSPQFIYYASPFAILIAILAGGSVLARTNQIVVLSAVGLGRSRIASIILAATVIVASGLVIAADTLLPATNREQDLRYHRIKNKQLEQTTIAFGRKWVFGRNRTIYSYQRIEADNTLYHGAAYRLSAGSNLLENTVIFNQAIQTGPTEWRVVSGQIESIGTNLRIDRRTIDADRGEHLIRIEDGADIFKRTVNESTKLSSGDLHDYIVRLDEMGIDSTEMDLDYQKRLAFPFSCLTLGILAIPFATTRRARRSSPVLSIAIGVIISLLLWLVMTIFESAGRQQSLPVNIAVWGPQMLFLAIGAFINARETKM